MLRGETNSPTTDQVETWFNINYQYLVKKERSYLAPSTRLAALEQVLHYVKREQGNWQNLQNAEVDVAFVKENYILRGTVDLIKGENGTVELVDFKAQQKPDLNRDRSEIEQYRRQLEVYAHILEGRSDMKVSRLHLYYTGEKSGNPYISFEKNPAAINETIDGFSDIVSRIERKDFRQPQRPQHLCGNCDLCHYCDAKQLVS